MAVYHDTLKFTGGVGRAKRAAYPADSPPRRFLWSAAGRWRTSWQAKAPSARAKRADMSRAAFLMLLTGWVAAVAMILAISLALRWLG